MRHSVLLPIIALAVIPVAAELPSVSKDAIEAHATFFADDTLQGRNTGSEGYAIAANYAASQFRQLGLEPGGDDGTFFQSVPFVESRLTGSVIDLEANGETVALHQLDDYILRGNPLEPTSAIEAPIAFVGFGIDAPQMDHRDYAGIDVRGKVILMFNGAPASFPPDERAHFSSRRLKAEEAARRGALGLLVIRTKIDKAKVPWQRYLAFADSPSYNWIHPNGDIQDAFDPLKFAGYLSSDGARKLAGAAGASYDEWLDHAEAVSYETSTLDVEINVRTEMMHAKVRSPNVVAILRGSDPRLSSEYVVVSAHLDHVGVGQEVDGDRIYNGYYDNAMGSSIVMELARVLANAERPARSIIFLLVTGEEKGLLGSDYFASHPTVPKDALVANVNIDMPLLLHATTDVIAYGAEHSSLGANAAEAAAATGFTLSPDPDPSEVIFVRSDQYSFIRQGIPAIYVDPGLGSADGSDSGRTVVLDFIRTHYHRPSDDTSRPVDWETAVRYVRMNAVMTLEIANAPERPRWNKNDFFGVLFGGYGAK